jgi:hypothetical protein
MESSCVEAALESIQEIIDEKVVIGRERSTWLTGCKPLPPQFLALTEIEGEDGLSAFAPGRVDTLGSGPNIMA